MDPIARGVDPIARGLGLKPGDYHPRYGADPYSTWNVWILKHESGHTWQADRLGPFFLPLYFLHGGVSQNNPFERAADDYGQGLFQ